MFLTEDEYSAVLDDSNAFSECYHDVASFLTRVFGVDSSRPARCQRNSF